jgi:hypothetical protein
MNLYRVDIVQADGSSVPLVDFCGVRLWRNDRNGARRAAHVALQGERWRDAQRAEVTRIGRAGACTLSATVRP